MVANDLVKLLDDNYLDETLYFQCREYVKLYLLLEELVLIKDYDTDEFIVKGVVEDLIWKLGVLLTDLDVSLSRVLNKNYEIVTDLDKDIERFNYVYTFNEYANLRDINNRDFCIRVYNEDIVELDELINGLNNNVEDLKGANHNLNRVITNYSKLLTDKIEEYKDDGEIRSVLEVLRDELLFG